MAQVALLQTEMNSGFRFVPRIGMNSAAGHTQEQNGIIMLDTPQKQDDDNSLIVKETMR